MVVSIQTYGDRAVNWQPHLHALVTAGVERLGRYLVHPPIALGRLQYDGAWPDTPLGGRTTGPEPQRRSLGNRRAHGRREARRNAIRYPRYLLEKPACRRVRRTAR